MDALYGESSKRRFSWKGKRERGRDAARPRSCASASCSSAARSALETTHPGAVAALARRARALDHLLRRISLSFSSLDDPPPPSTILWNTLKALAVIVLGFPVAVLGVAAWWVPYRLCGFVANRVPGAADAARPDRALQAHRGRRPLPVSRWLMDAPPCWVLGGPLWAALALLFLPFAGISSLLFFEYAAWRERQARELLTLLVAPGRDRAPQAERDALVAEMRRGSRTRSGRWRIIRAHDVDVPAATAARCERASEVLAGARDPVRPPLSTSCRRCSRGSSPTCSCTAWRGASGAAACRTASPAPSRPLSSASSRRASSSRAAILLHGFVRGRVGDLPGLLASVGETLKRSCRLSRASGSLCPGPRETTRRSKAGWIASTPPSCATRASSASAGSCTRSSARSSASSCSSARPTDVDTPLAAALASGSALRRRVPVRREGPARDLRREHGPDGVSSCSSRFRSSASRLPLAGTLVALTFVCGLLPVVGQPRLEHLRRAPLARRLALGGGRVGRVPPRRPQAGVLPEREDRGRAHRRRRSGRRSSR